MEVWRLGMFCTHYFLFNTDGSLLCSMVETSIDNLSSQSVLEPYTSGQALSTMAPHHEFSVLPEDW